LSDVLHAQWSLCRAYLQVEYLSKRKNQKIRKQEEKQGTTPFFLGIFGDFFLKSPEKFEMHAIHIIQQP
jgi:hypothetical protein